MSLSLKSNYTWLQKFGLNSIKAGPVPKHVAFIMDGNRRFAKKNNISVTTAHRQGYTSMTAVRRWCLDTGIQEVTFYALSIENFKRSKREVEELLLLSKEKLEHIYYVEMEEIMADEVCIRIFGDLSVVGDDLRNLIARIILKTKDNKKSFMNIAFAYTSREEIKTTLSSILEGVEKNIIDENEITEQLISECLYTNNSPKPDLLLRTSGEVRFSDFLMWQTSAALLLFTDNLWPEFGVWRIWALIFHYQRHYKRIQAIKLSQELEYAGTRSIKVQEFINKLNQRRMKILESYIQD